MEYEITYKVRYKNNDDYYSNSELYLDMDEAKGRYFELLNQLNGHWDYVEVIEGRIIWLSLFKTGECE